MHLRENLYGKRRIAEQQDLKSAVDCQYNFHSQNEVCHWYQFGQMSNHYMKAKNLQPMINHLASTQEIPCTPCHKKDKSVVYACED